MKFMNDVTKIKADIISKILVPLINFFKERSINRGGKFFVRFCRDFNFEVLKVLKIRIF
jgi:hypothetical protein